MKNRKKKAGSRNYYGEIRLRLESVENFTQVDSLCRDLEATGCLEIVARTWSERKGMIGCTAVITRTRSMATPGTIGCMAETATISSGAARATTTSPAERVTT